MCSNGDVSNSAAGSDKLTAQRIVVVETSFIEHTLQNEFIRFINTVQNCEEISNGSTPSHASNAT